MSVDSAYLTSFSSFFQQMTQIFPRQSVTLTLFLGYVVRRGDLAVSWACNISLSSHGQVTRISLWRSLSIFTKTVAKKFFLLVGLLSWSCWWLFATIRERLSENEVTQRKSEQEDEGNKMGREEGACTHTQTHTHRDTHSHRHTRTYTDTHTHMSWILQHLKLATPGFIFLAG